MGRAVITSDVPGCRDTVVDGVNGFLRTCFISVGQDRTVGESTQYAFDVIEVDHDNRRITFKRFGKGDDYSYGY